MKILLTNHQLLDFQGSETFTYTIAAQLKRLGHEVIVYSAYLDQLVPVLQRLGIQVVNQLSAIANEKFDIAHVHHNINAMEVRHTFPKLPILFLSHGVLPFLEQPPVIDLNISLYLAVSEEVRENLIKQGVAQEKIVIFRNAVDPAIYFPTHPIHEKPQKALVISNKLDEESESIIRAACNRLQIECKFVGKKYGRVPLDKIPFFINEADIVFSLGRGVIETMLCGRIPIVYDYQGGDGMVTPGNIQELMRRNFSGRTHQYQYSVEELIEVLENYDARNGNQLYEFALQTFGAGTQIAHLVNLYLQHAKDQPEPLSEKDQRLVSAFVETIRDTRIFTGYLFTRSTSEGHDRTHQLEADRVREQAHRQEIITQAVQEADRLTSTGSFQAAAQAMETCLSKYPDSIEIYPLLVILYTQLGDFPAVEMHLLNALSYDPFNIDWLNQLGTVRFYLGKYTESRLAFLNALENDPENAEAKQNLMIVEDKLAIDSVAKPG